MHFDFQLTSQCTSHEEFLREIVETSWIFSTFGSYSISAGGQKLFQYQAWFRDLLVKENPGQHNSDCALGYVGKLYLDFIRVLPYAIEEVPSDLTHFLSCENNERWETTSTQWYDDAERRLEPDDPRWDIYEDAMKWRSSRMIDCDDLAVRPQIWIWRKGNEVSIEWDNQRVTCEGKTVYTAEIGNELNATSEFVKSISKFESNLLDSVFPPPNVLTNELRLVRDQEKAAAIRNQILKAKESYLNPAVTEWDRVRAGVREIMKAW